MLWSHRKRVLSDVDPLEISSHLMVRGPDPLPVDVVSHETARGAVTASPGPLERFLAVLIHGNRGGFLPLL